MIVIFVAFAAKAKGEIKKSPDAVIFKNIFGPSACSDRENNPNPCIYFLGSYQSVPVYRTQVQRTVVFFKTIFGTASKFSTYFHFLSNKYQHTSARYVRLCKLILFPFHVFW